jgi:starch phosphorylase
MPGLRDANASTDGEVRSDGTRDLLRACADLAQRLPESLAPLVRLAFNYRWSWSADGPDLFRSIDPERFELCLENPVRLLQEVSGDVLRRAAGDAELARRATELEAVVRADLARPPPDGPIDPKHPVAFFCAEYGVHRSLPVYSGGLGALAGDLLKEASDQALPLVAVGLMYRQGYFRQRVDASGWQHEYWTATDPERLPAALVTRPEGQPLTIRVPIFSGEVTARIWRVDVGRVPLFLLDTDFPDNEPLARWITARLYEGDPQTRLGQYVLLGVGGVRALHALGIEPGLIHLNEGHAALAPLELAGEIMPGAPLQVALAAARARTVFTTHTPVAAGNDSYPVEEAEEALEPVAKELGCPPADLLRLGRVHPDDETAPFGVTETALRMACAANGVSRRHGEVSREMWSEIWPGRAPAGIPIGHVTNGVHVPTWIGPAMRELFDRHLGEGWLQRTDEPETWAPVAGIPEADLWAARERQRADLVEFVRRRSVADRLGRSDTREYVKAAADTFDEHVLTIGFARRVATYKRLDLLTRDPEWTLSLLGGERPVQVLLAGKAHPKDEEAKRVLQRMFGLKFARVVAERVVFLDDYDLSSAARLVRGCDVWLNLPRPPLEASGTSGMKSAVNGGLQLSVLDGWWAEAYDGDNGWALAGTVDPDASAQDERDNATFHHLLSDEVVPAFYDLDERGVPSLWLSRMKASLQTLAPAFSASRMLADYVQGPYSTALHARV